MKRGNRHGSGLATLCISGYLALLLAACGGVRDHVAARPSPNASARALASLACDGFAASGDSSTAADSREPDGGVYDALVQPITTAGRAAGLDPRWQQLVNALTAYQARAAAGDEPELQAEAAEAVAVECQKTRG